MAEIEVGNIMYQLIRIENDLITILFQKAGVIPGGMSDNQG